MSYMVTKMSSPSNENNSGPQSKSPWTFLTNHSHVLICLDRSPEATLREVALLVGITERAVQRIVADLEAEAIIVRNKLGRRNSYQINKDLALRHPVEEHRTVGELLVLGQPRTEMDGS